MLYGEFVQEFKFAMTFGVPNIMRNFYLPKPSLIVVVPVIKNTRKMFALHFQLYAVFLLLLLL